MRILLVRHGETLWNIGKKRFRGQMDIELSDFGLRQAEATGKRFTKESIEAIFFSPLARTRQTAEGIKKYNPNISFLEEPLLLDISFGDWQGRTHEEVFAEDPIFEDYWNNHPEKLSFPNGESWFRVFERIDLLFKKIAKLELGTIVLVTHRVVANIILLYILGLEISHFWDFEIETTSITEIKLEKNGSYTIIKTNDTTHLPKKEK